MSQLKESDYQKKYSRASVTNFMMFSGDFGSEFGFVRQNETPFTTEDIINILKPESTRKIFKTLNDLKRGRKRLIHNKTLSLLRKVASINIGVLPNHLKLYAGNLVIPCQYELNKIKPAEKETWWHHLFAVFGFKFIG